MPTKIEELLDILMSSPEPTTTPIDVKEDTEGGSVTKRSMFTKRTSHPLILDALLLDAFGADWLSWEPETVWSEIELTFGVTPSMIVQNAINAVKTCHLVDAVWTEWEVFCHVVSALTGNVPDFKVLIRPEPTQIAPAIDMMALIQKLPYSDEVARFVAACYLDSGIIYLPPPTDFAQRYATMPRYRCKKCGRFDSDEDNDFCDSCGAPDHLLERVLGNDPEPIRKRYEEVMKHGDARDFWLQEDVVDVQVAKLVLVQQRRVEYHRSLKAQAEAVR
jgi:hypothetical protein